MALNETNIQHLLKATAVQGYGMALNVESFTVMPVTTNPPASNRSWMSRWRGLEVRLVVGLALGPRSRLGKEGTKKTKNKTKMKKKKTDRIPCDEFSTAATNCPSAVQTKKYK